MQPPAWQSEAAAFNASVLAFPLLSPHPASNKATPATAATDRTFAPESTARPYRTCPHGHAQDRWTTQRRLGYREMIG